MKGSLKVVTITGVPIRLHWSLVLLVVFAIGPGMTTTLLAEAAWIVAIFACVLLHELGHSILARHRGLKVRDIVLMPFGGFSEIIGMASSPSDEAAIALAGPLTNGAIAALLATVAATIGLGLWPPTLFARAWLVRIVWANVALTGLNLLPALPLDGGRALRGLLGRSRRRTDATAIAAGVSTTIAVLMIVTGLLMDLWIALIGGLVLVGAHAEQRMAATGELLGDLTVKSVMISDTWALAADDPVTRAAPLLQQLPSRAFTVADGGHAVGVITASDLVAHPHALTVRDAADTLAPILDVDDLAYPTALDAFAESGRKALAVATEGHPAGVVYLSDIESWLRQRPSRAAR